MFCQQFGIFNLRALDHLAINHKVHIGIELFADGIYHFGMPVTGVADTDAGDEIEVFFAGRAMHKNSFCLNDFKEQWGW